MGNGVLTYKTFYQDWMKKNPVSRHCISNVVWKRLNTIEIANEKNVRLLYNFHAMN